MIFNVPNHIQYIRNGLSKRFINSHGVPARIVKTQTRRLNRGIYQVGKNYAVQRKRGVKAEPDIRIVMDRIWHETTAGLFSLRESPTSFVIMVHEAWAEGGYTPAEYEILFRKLNPKWDETVGRWAYKFHVIEVRK